jgi:ParB family chromosome partitioning protein
MDFTQAAPSLSQAQRLKKLRQESGMQLEDMCEILGEVKKGDLERVAFQERTAPVDTFPSPTTPRQIAM